MRPGPIIRWITSFIVLAALFFILPASCDDPNTNGGSTDGGGDGGTMPLAPITEAPGITSGGFSISVSVTMSHSLAGVTIYYRAASDTTTDLSVAINPNDNTTYTGTGTSVSPATFTSPGDVYRIKAVAVATDGRVSPETAIQRFDYDIDSDDDGLIDIRNLEMFSNIRFNLAGTTYDDEDADTPGDLGITTGGPTSATTACQTDPDGDTFFLCGYELMGNLDFAQASSYESGTVNATWCPDTSNDCVNTTGAGFPGIGPATGDTGGFTAIFEGNNNSISNFYSRNTANTNNANIGLFALINDGGTIRNLAVEANVFGGTATDRIGGLVGYNNTGGIIVASSATGSADGGAGATDRVGSLVGQNEGTIIASSATGSADGGAGDTDRVGVLAGRNEGTIIASSATGSADGGTGNFDFVGGLVGENLDTITASYATGDADGGDGTGDRVGGLVGDNAGAITASYATGVADGGDGATDRVGGLVGDNFPGTITASYATGVADGGDGANDSVGGLLGNLNGTITESYGFGTVTTEAGETEETVGTGTNLPMGVTTASALTAANAGTTASSFWWDEASSTGAGAWDFGMDDTENPALVYSDYDGDAGNTYPSCSNAEGLFLTIPGTTTQIVCGMTLVGGYRAP